MTLHSNHTRAGQQDRGQSPEAPLVSVIMPAFNGEAYIGEAIRSALDQDYPQVEVIVIDDGSSDGTIDVVRAFGNRVRLLQQINKGSAAARNLGVGEARGHYVAFLDADDVWRQGKLREQVDAMRASGYKMAYSQFKIWNPSADGRFLPAREVFASTDPELLGDIQVVTGWTYADLLLDCFVWTSTVIVEREEVLKAGLFNESLRKGQDYDLWLRLSRNIPMLGLEKPTALYRHHGSNITHGVKEVNYEYLILSTALKKWGESGPDSRVPPKDKVKARLAKSMLSHAHSHYRYGSPRIAAESFKFAMAHTGPRLDLQLMYYLSRLKARLQAQG